MKLSIKWMLALGAVAVGGCGQITGPAPDPEPTKVPMPKPDYFDPKDFVTAGTPLNAADDASKPNYFQLDQVLSGTTLKLIGVSKGVLGTSNIYHLEGIVTPEKGQQGYDQTIKTIQDWTVGQHLDVELDTKYPFDNDNEKQVQVYFFGSGTDKPRLLLNRMLVRSGYAVCDLDQATSANVEGWLNDEQFARQHVPPLGLWSTGIFTTIAHRQPPPTATPIGGANAASGNGPGANGAASSANGASAPANGMASPGNTSVSAAAGTKKPRHRKSAGASGSSSIPTGALPAPAPQ